MALPSVKQNLDYQLKEACTDVQLHTMGLVWLIITKGLSSDWNQLGSCVRQLFLV